ncbi:type IV secretion protein Rhs [Capsulimonas corticalis]|uniref:Type IV secretion protein Rhs n=1 Tax=Capsulimonas corticalis TaxID=2219043 RepID=A0A402D4I1_9BACT|nr:RHS repeat-associated core domain-containing protein [Capsulimonas corticalis]BDI29293.1 type IV secretion protein Rhs [Capsulimonas corticalis]
MRALKHRLLALFLLLFVSIASRPAAAVVPGTPTLTAASYTYTQTFLTWTAVSGNPTSFNIYRSTTPGAEVLVTNLFAGSTVDSGLASGTVYYYQITAVNASGESPRSAEVSAVTGLPVSLIRGGHQAVTVSWTPPGGSNAAGYNVYRVKQIGGAYAKVNASPIAGSSYLDTGLENGTPYFYEVSAVSAGGTESIRSTPYPITPNVHVNCGGSSVYPDSVGFFWAANTGSSTGTNISTAVQQNGSSAALPSSDQPLYQNQLQEATPGAGITYNLPVTTGAYTLVLGFSEISATAAGQRKFNVTANGQQILTNYDIFSTAGAANKVVSTAARVNVQSSGTLTLVFTGTVGSACVATISLQPITAPAADAPEPGYASPSVPLDRATSADGAGPASSFFVVVPSLVAENHPGVDIAAYNPVGPSVSYERSYRSNLTTLGYSAPGLGVGWTDNFDLNITSASASTWGPLTLVYGNQAKETFTPTVTGGTATFTHPAGAPYVVTGVPSGTVGQWTSITLTFKDHTQMTFTPADPAVTNVKYVYSKLTNLVGRFVSINRDTAANGNRVLTVTNDVPTTLLQFNYTGALLASVQDLASATPSDNRQVNYIFDGGSRLVKVSEIFTVGGTVGADRWRYGYQAVNNKSYLGVVDVPDPSHPGGTSYSRGKLFYDQTGVVSLTTDAAGRQTSYLPNPNAQLVVAVNSNADGSQAMSHRQYYSSGLNLNAGFQDGGGQNETLSYSDANNPRLPTSDINRNGQSTGVTYNDAFGNPATVRTPRGVVVTNTYDFTNFPLGQVTNSQETHQTGGTTDATKQATSYTYYGPSDGALNGLVHTITSPAPDSTVALPSLVMTTITYTLPSSTSAGGQVLTVAEPGNNAGGTLTTTYNYTSDPSYDANGAPGSYSQNEVIGEPLTVTNPAGNVTHYRYDGRGNVILSIDAIGNKTNYVYNTADQLVQTIAPATNTSTPTARAYTQTNYQYPGGPAASEQVYDESGALVREVDTAYTADGEVASVMGSTEPVSYTYDGLSRVSTLKDGNNHVTNYSYDPVGNLAKIQYPGVSGVFDTLTFTYDHDQNLQTKVDGRGITTTYARVDPESQVTGIAYSGLPATVTPIGTTSFAYDVYGRLSLMTDNTGTTGYSNYDDLDEPLLMTRSFTGGPQNQQISYAHYPDGSRKTLTTPVGVTNPLTGINSGNFTYSYDLAGRLTQQKVPFTFYNINLTQGDFLTHQWNANGWLKRTDNLLTAPDEYASTRTNYTYNARGFITALTNYQYDPANNLLSNIATFNNLTYDAVGNRLSQYTNMYAFGAAPDGSRSLRFGYDTAHASALQNRDVLASEASSLHGGSASAAYNDVYTNNFLYDGAYSITQFAMGGATQAFGNTVDNQISNSGYLPDGNGNMTTYQGAAFSYDPEDRLTAISSPMFSATYDGNGLRATKTAGGATTYFLYDGGAPLLEETFSGSNATISAVNVWAADGWRGRYYPTAPVPFYSAYNFDPQGNIITRQLTNNTATRTYDFASYEAYGKRTADFQDDNGANPAALQEPAGYGGQYGYYTDRETGLLCLTHRYYDPGTGRFINRDPIGYQGGVNLYGYAGGNPVNESDPSGYDYDKSLGDMFASWDRAAGNLADRVNNSSSVRFVHSTVHAVKKAYIDFATLYGKSQQDYVVSTLVWYSKPGAFDPPARRNRASEYPHGNSDEIREEVIARHTDAQGRVIDPVTQEEIPKDQITIDHKEPVVKHWNRIGYNQTAAQRRAWYNDTNNLTVKPWSENSRSGARLRIKYRQDVGPNYTR